MSIKRILCALLAGCMMLPLASCGNAPAETETAEQDTAAVETEKETTVMLGDQVFTDVFAGKRMGLRAILVKPIRDKRTLFFRFKRWLEIPVLKIYSKDHNKDK